MAVLEQRERRRFTAEEVMLMLESGILDEDEPVELLEGELVLVSPQGPDHASVTEQIADLIRSLFGPEFHVRRHSPLAASITSLPEPDVALVVGRPRDYRQRHPRGEETPLVVEVASTSRPTDRRKASFYARAGVPNYWLVDLVGRRLEVHTEPDATGKYALVRVLEPGQAVQVPGTNRQLAVNELLAGE